MGEFVFISGKRQDPTTKRDAENAIKILTDYQQTQSKDNQVKMQSGIERIADLYNRGQYFDVVRALEDFAR